MAEITKTEGGFTGTIIVAEHNKNRIRVIGRFGQNDCGLRPYEAVLEIGEEWTDGYEIEIRHALAYDHPDAMDHDEWTEKIEFFVPAILWGADQEYEALVTDEHRSLVAAL